MSQQSLKAFSAKLAADESLRSEMIRVLSQDGEKGSASVEEMMAGGIISPGFTQLQTNTSPSYSVDSFSLNLAKISY